MILDKKDLKNFEESINIEILKIQKRITFKVFFITNCLWILGIGLYLYFKI